MMESHMMPTTTWEDTDEADMLQVFILGLQSLFIDV